MNEEVKGKNLFNEEKIIDTGIKEPLFISIPFDEYRKLQEEIKNADERNYSLGFDFIQIGEKLGLKNFATQTILREIDKLQEENAELKENNLSYQEELAKAWKENEELKKKNEELDNEISEMYLTDSVYSDHFILKDKIREYCKRELAFKNRLEREKQEISEYNKGCFDTYLNIIEELLGENE